MKVHETPLESSPETCTLSREQCSHVAERNLGWLTQIGICHKTEGACTPWPGSSDTDHILSQKASLNVFGLWSKVQEN